MKAPAFNSIFSREKVNKKIASKQVVSGEQTPYESFEEGNFVSTTDTAGLFVSNLITGQQNNQARSRQEIMRKWRNMEKDPVISTALRLNIIAALGGHETEGSLIFIEDKSDISDEEKRLNDELREDLDDQFNKMAFSMAYNGAAFGDSYCRTYYEKGRGLVRAIHDETVHPTLILPYEQAGKTVGFLAGTANKQVKLSTLQMARLKMPRIAWIPQHSVVEKSAYLNLKEDNINNLPIIPSLLGGSFLFAAEEPYERFYTSLSAVVGQRWVDSIDESLISVNLTGASPNQQTKLKESLTRILGESKAMAEKAMRGTPNFSRIRHLLFTTNEKQVLTQGEGMGSKRASNMSMEDILFHARVLSGALGIDLSMLGFADQLSGGLGDGGFFRVSAQVAEGSRVTRAAMTDFYNEIIDNHMLHKYGKKYSGKRPYSINYYGSISAYEKEKQSTRLDAVNASGLIVQTLSQLKDLGLGEKEMIQFLSKEMLLDQDEAEMYARSMISASKNDSGKY